VNGVRWTSGGAASARCAWAFALALLLAPSGCYRYVPAEPVQPIHLAQEELRVVLHPEATRRLAASSGRDLRYLEGRVVEATDDSISVSIVVGGREHRGTPFEGARRIVTVDRSEVVELQRREFARGRTAYAIRPGCTRQHCHRET
jgi:hypothetical protein